jgi:hypothetical protein
VRVDYEIISAAALAEILDTLDEAVAAAHFMFEMFLDGVLARAAVDGAHSFIALRFP